MVAVRKPERLPCEGVGRIYQQTFIDTYSKMAFAKLYSRKTPITAADLFNDRIVSKPRPEAPGLMRTNPIAAQQEKSEIFKFSVSHHGSAGSKDHPESVRTRRAPSR